MMYVFVLQERNSQVKNLKCSYSVIKTSRNKRPQFGGRTYATFTDSTGLKLETNS